MSIFYKNGPVISASTFQKVFEEAHLAVYDENRA